MSAAQLGTDYADMKKVYVQVRRQAVEAHNTINNRISFKIKNETGISVVFSSSFFLNRLSQFQLPATPLLLTLSLDSEAFVLATISTLLFKFVSIEFWAPVLLR